MYITKIGLSLLFNAIDMSYKEFFIIILISYDEIFLFNSISFQLNMVIYDKKINLKAINTEHVTNVTKLQHTPNVVNNV